MASISSNGTGLWSATGTWVGGVVPVDGDTVTIVSGHIVTFDVDQSAFTSGVVLIVNGTLTVSTTAGTYYLKTSSATNTSGTAGVINAGSVGTALPNTVKWTWNLNGARSITATGLTLNLYCTSPANISTNLSAGVSASATVLPVTTNLTGDIWAAGDIIRIDNINKGLDSEERVISAISSTTITISAGLTNSKLSGAYIWRISRNIRITGCTGTANPITGGTNTHVLNCEFSGNSTTGVVINVPSVTFGGTMSGPGTGSTGNATGGSSTSFNASAGSVISGFGTAINSTPGANVAGNISGCAFAAASALRCSIGGAITGCTTGVSGVAGGVISAAIKNCTTGITGCQSVQISGNLTNHTTAIVNTTGVTQGAALSSNTTDVQNDASQYTLVGYGATLGSAAQVNANYKTNTNSAKFAGIVLWDAGGVAGSVQAWMFGGRIINDTSTLPPSTTYTNTHNHIFESASAPCFLDVPVFLESGRVYTWTFSVKKDTNSMTETPSVALIDTTKATFDGAAILTSQAMTDNTSWQTLTLTYTATSTRPYALRVRGAHASGNLWWNMTQSSGALRPVGMNGGM